MERETLQVEFVTPCFLGGASQGAEWRAASIRGELRWWFRAVAGAELGLEEVRKAEAAIFGSTERQAQLRIRALGGPAPVSHPFGQGRNPDWLAAAYGAPSEEARLAIRSNPIHYLGYGPIDRGEMKREYLPPGASATIELRWGPGTLEEKNQKLFEKALWAWLNLGGIGGRSRRGFGSLRLLRMEGGRGPAILPELAPTDRKALEEQIKRFLRSAQGKSGGRQEWTHVSGDSRVFLGCEAFQTWEGAMERLGAWLIGFRRRYGKQTDGRTIDGLSLAGRDYEWAAPKGGNQKGGFPDRAGFGLPLPFTKHGRGQTVLWGTPPKERRDDQEREKDSRRASPLLLHVASFGNQSFLPVLTYLPAAFLPPGKILKFKGDQKLSSPVTPEQEKIVPRFLETLVGNKVIQEVTP
jgi:CRISPR-associated protein Cmr1